MPAGPVRRWLKDLRVGYPKDLEEHPYETRAKFELAMAAASPEQRVNGLKYVKSCYEVYFTEGHNTDSFPPKEQQKLDELEKQVSRMNRVEASRAFIQKMGPPDKFFGSLMQTSRQQIHSEQDVRDAIEAANKRAREAQQQAQYAGDKAQPLSVDQRQTVAIKEPERNVTEKVQGVDLRERDQREWNNFRMQEFYAVDAVRREDPTVKAQINSRADHLFAAHLLNTSPEEMRLIRAGDLGKEAGFYRGMILAEVNGQVYQDVGNKTVVMHTASEWLDAKNIGTVQEVDYSTDPKIGRYVQLVQDFDGESKMVQREKGQAHEAVADQSKSAIKSADASKGSGDGDKEASASKEKEASVGMSF